MLFHGRSRLYPFRIVPTLLSCPEGKRRQSQRSLALRLSVLPNYEIRNRFIRSARFASLPLAAANLERRRVQRVEAEVFHVESVASRGLTRRLHVSCEVAISFA